MTHLPLASKNRRGFTLVEVLVSTVVLAVLLLVMATILDSVQRSWRRSKEKVDQFRDARAAFESITRQLSQATLNTYWDYHYRETGSNVPPEDQKVPPAGYVRHSELQFLSGSAEDLIGSLEGGSVSGHALFFQAPLGHSRTYRGLGSLLNGRGFYLQWRDDSSSRPTFLPPAVSAAKRRYQLMEYRPVAEQAQVESGPVSGNTIYTKPSGWHLDDLARQSRALASNILAFIVSPQAAVVSDDQKPWWIAPSYRYDSRDTDNSTPALNPVVITDGGEVRQGTQHLLPPLVRVTLVAADEDSFARWLADHSEVDGGLLKKADAPFTDAASHDADLSALKRYLDSQRLNYRVFTLVVPLRNATWDRRLSSSPPVSP
jgi:uncharacterized protein (TIGR02599 family)